MIKQRIVDSLKRTLWQLTGRDYLVLNPHFALNNINKDSLILSKQSKQNTKYLPVKYNYYTPKHWNLVYAMRGVEQGQLRFTLSTPNGHVFCETELDVILPLELNVCLKNGDVFANNQKMSLKSGEELPLQTAWLIGNFEFRTPTGFFQRQTGHRVKLSLAENAEADYYNGEVYDNYDEDAVAVPKEIFSSIEKYHKSKGRFLDIGCATGLTVEYAVKQGFEAEGIDFSEWAVNQANERTGGKCRVLNFDMASPADFNFRYDVITLHSVIEHLRYPEECINKLYDLCNPGAIIYIQTLNSDSLMHSVMGDDWGGYTDYTHQSPWISADWLVNIATHKGFEILSVKRYHLWNDNIYDDVWNALNIVFQVSPLNVLLEDGYGDAVELVIRKPNG